MLKHTEVLQRFSPLLQVFFVLIPHQNCMLVWVNILQIYLQINSGQLHGWTHQCLYIIVCLSVPIMLFTFTNVLKAAYTHSASTNISQLMNQIIMLSLLKYFFMHIAYMLTFKTFVVFYSFSYLPCSISLSPSYFLCVSLF